MARLDSERQARLEPERIKKAILEVEKLGILVTDIHKTHISFLFNDEIVTYFAYSGWATGKSIKDGRGLNHLLKELKSNQILNQ